MKKQYNPPKVEKVEFNYSEAVVASGTHCDWFITHTQGEQGCLTTEVKNWHPDVNS